jgi:hypothetical protein
MDDCGMSMIDTSSLEAVSEACICCNPDGLGLINGVLSDLTMQPLSNVTSAVGNQPTS